MINFLFSTEKYKTPEADLAVMGDLYLNNNEEAPFIATLGSKGNIIIFPGIEAIEAMIEGEATGSITGIKIGKTEATITDKVAEFQNGFKFSGIQMTPEGIQKPEGGSNTEVWTTDGGTYNVSNISIDVDDELKSDSTNPVQNKVIYKKLGDIDTALTEIIG